MSVALLDAEARARRALLEARKGRLRVADLVEPWFLPHRMGGANIAPDNTLEGLDAAVAQGATICDGGDLWLGRDGSLLSMHDGTVDRTTSSTGNTADHTAMSWATLAVDAGSWFAPAWSNTLRPPTFHQILARRHPVVLAPEIKTSGAAAAQAVIDAIRAYGAEESVIITAGGSAALEPIKAAGLLTMRLMLSDADPGLAEILDLAPDYVAFLYTSDVADATLAAIGDAGIKITTWTVDRRSAWAALQAREAAIGHPIVGVYSDDPFWLAGTAPVLSSDPFGLNTYYHGQIRGTSCVRPTLAGGKLVYADAGKQWSLQGWGSKDAPQASIQASITFDTLSATLTEWAGIGFGCEDDASYVEGGGSPHGNGYSAFLRQNGNLQLFRRDGATSTSIATTVTTPAVSAGQTVPLKVEFIGNTVKATRVDTGHSASATDTTYRGGYFHFGKNGTLLVSFSACSTT